MHPSRMQKGMASRGSPGMTWSKSCTCIQLPHRWFWGIQIYQYITFCWIYHSTRDSGLETKQHANHSNCFFPGISPLEESPNLHTGKRNLIRGWYIHGRQTEGLNQLQDWHDISTCWITQSLGYLFGDSSAFLLLSGNSASHSGWLVLYTEWASQDTSNMTNRLIHIGSRSQSSGTKQSWLPHWKIFVLHRGSTPRYATSSSKKVGRPKHSI